MPKIERTKKGLPAMWERGGSATNTGDAIIIAGTKGEALTPLYVRSRGDLSNGDHALFVVGEGYIVVFADHHRGDFVIEVARLTGEFKPVEFFGQPCEEAEMYLLGKFSQGEWTPGFDPEDFRAAIEAAKEKATEYHCRRPVYFKEAATEPA